MPQLIRIFIGLVTCPLLGAMVGWGTVGGLLATPSAHQLGWTAGLLLGIAYAAGVIKLTLCPKGTADRTAGDRLLIFLSLMAVIDVLVQLSRLQMPWLWQVIGIAYSAGLYVTLRRLWLSAHGH